MVGTERQIPHSGAHLDFLPPLYPSLHLFALLSLYITSSSRLQEICNQTEYFGAGLALEVMVTFPFQVCKVGLGAETWDRIMT